MRIDWLQPLLGQTPPFASVYIDITGVGETAGRETESRWRGLRRDLERAEAPSAVIDSLEQAITSPPSRSGAGGRLLIANEQGVHIDRELAVAPTPSEAVYGPDPALLPGAICADNAVDHLIVTVDRSGADLSRSGTDFREAPTRSTVEGDQDEITRTKAPEMLQRKVDHRAHDSWDRNAAVVAAELDRIAEADPPEIMLVTGDVRATKLVCQAVGPKAAELIVEIQGGARGAGVNEEAFAGEVRKALDEFRGRRRERVLARYQEGLGRGTGAVSSIENLIEVLQRGQVEEVIILESALTHEPLRERRAWVGPEPLQLVLNESDLESLGIQEARQMQVIVAIVRAALGQNAGITFVPDDDADVADHVGAILRWDDEDTPRESVPSLSNDPERLRNLS